MNQQEILEYNKRCAEFLGFKCSINEQYELPKMMTFPPKKNSNLCYTAKICCIDDMQFHIDWNWIKSLLEKISSLNEDDFSDKTQQAFEDLLDLSLFSSKESVCESINNFIKTIK